MEIRRKEIMWIYLSIVFFNVLVLTDGWSVDRDFDDRYLNFRRKRRTNCEEKFATITHGHSACLQRSPSVQDSGVSNDDRQKIVEEHNRLRRKVYPPAKNMREMSWDEGIAITAQKWADNCIIGHDERYKRYDYGRFDVGQNLCWSTYKMNWDEAMSLWSNETKDYQYGSSHGVSAVAHYTQIIWADTSLVGCGYSHCKGTHFYVCNYGPAGNYDISKPYEAGQTCADCPHNCRDKLCDCRGKVCFNGGKMDLKTCTCTCNKDFDFYVPPYCDLNCTGIKEPSYCRKQFGPATCEIYSNVPQMCPSMCKWCPGKKSLVAVHSTDNSENTSKRRYDQMLREKQREDEIKRHKTTHDVNQREDERRKNEHAVSTKQRPDTRRQHHEMVPNINHDDSPRTYKGRVLNTNYRNTGSRFESTGTKIKHTHTDRRHDSSDIDSRRWHEVKHNENPYLDSMRGYKENYGDNRHGNAQANYDSTNTKRIHEGDTVYRMGDRDHRRQYEYDRTSYTDRESNRRHESTRVRTGLRENKERLGNSQPDAANNCKETQTDTIPTTRFMCKCANSAYPVHLGLLKAWFILLSLQAMYLL